MIKNKEQHLNFNQPIDSNLRVGIQADTSVAQKMSLASDVNTPSVNNGSIVLERVLSAQGNASIAESTIF